MLLEKQIDRAMAPLALTHPELHRRYFEARKTPRRSRTAEEPATAPVAATPTVSAPLAAEKAAA